MVFNRKSLSYVSVLGLSLVGIFAPFPGLKSHSVERKLQLDQDAPPVGMTKAQSGLSDLEWTNHLTLSYQAGCANVDNCDQCRGNCGSDDDCYGILKCLKREGTLTPIPGCILPASGYGGNVCYLPDNEYYPPSPPLPNPLVTTWWPPCSADKPCDMCDGLCNVGQDDQCAGSLRCSSFINNAWPTGDKNCNENGWPNAARGYCMPAEDYVDPTNLHSPSADWDPTVPDHGELIVLPECPPEGCPVCTAPMNYWWGCTDDSVCEDDLVCYNHRGDTDIKTQQVSGCSSNKIKNFGYCYTKDKDYTPPEIPHLTEAPTNDDFVLTNVADAPKDCEVYAVDQKDLVDIQFSGSSEVGIKKTLFHRVTYIYVVDASQSTRQFFGDAYCGDANSDLGIRTPIDCEILAIQTVNEAANAGGNVDLVGLIQFNNEAALKQDLIEPWAKLSPIHRDPAVVHQARTITPKEATNFQAGVELACEMAQSPANDNDQTIVIFLSDGAPNLGTSSKELIQNNCGNAVFQTNSAQTFAVTAHADCDAIDDVNLRQGIDSPDTLREIASYSGGTCTQVPDVGILPELLVQLEKTTWDGVTVKVNDVETNATINYSTAVPFEAPNSVTFSGSVALGPGEHNVCLEAVSTTSGVTDKSVVCKTVVVEAITAEPEEQLVEEGTNAQFTIGFVGSKHECDTFAGKDITVELCDGSAQVLQTKTGPDGEVMVTVPPLEGKLKACYNACYTAANGSKSCTKATVDYLKPGTIPPTKSEATQPPGGVNGDPLIMGLSGQLFKFDGRSGAWYSAVSTPSFQWNLKINRYETCPSHSDTFVSGAGFTFLKNGKRTKMVEVNVVNPYNVDVGCGNSEVQNCLGAGSLELVIDGVKHIVGGDYMTKDKSARITAFNTFYQCSRKWYDFDASSTLNTTSLRNGRNLATDQNVFDVITGLKNTMINAEECQQWIDDRRGNGDLFLQPGHYSTIIIKTVDVTFHLEYRQENQRCNAHSIDVWISSIDSRLLDERWEGIIGETKDVNYVPTGEGNVMVDRKEALKFSEDEDYEVNSPYATKCKGCSKT